MLRSKSSRIAFLMLAIAPGAYANGFPSAPGFPTSNNEIGFTIQGAPVARYDARPAASASSAASPSHGTQFLNNEIGRVFVGHAVTTSGAHTDGLNHNSPKPVTAMTIDERLMRQRLYPNY